jgi:hypothetical protein
LVSYTEGRTQAEVFENRIMREMFGLKWEEVTGNWRKLRNEELHDLYSSQNITEVIKS